MTATILNFKTKNQIYKDFKNFIETALAECNITGWHVKKLHQIIKTEDLKPSIFIQILSKKQLGSQYRSKTKSKQTTYTYNNNFFGFANTGLMPANQKPFTDGSPVRAENTVITYYKDYKVKEEITIRFSATRRENINDTVETLNGLDVLEIIGNYFQSLKGIDLFAQSGYAQYRISDYKEQTFINDDENVQLMPYFDCTYLYTDTWNNEINNIDKVIENKIIGV